MTHDVLIVGAGPAGSVAARRLATAGARVALIGGASRTGWEGLSERSVALLAEEGVGIGSGIGVARHRSSCITGPYARCGTWAGGRAVLGTEWLVERRDLAAELQSTALAAGVDLRHDTVNHLERRDDEWRAQLRGGAVLTAPITIDARGRRGSERRGPLLLAVGRQFRLPSAHACTSVQGTHIEALDDGWCWWAIRGRTMWVQIIRQPRAGAPPSRHPARWLGAAAAQIPALSPLLDEITPEGDAVARPAHARRSTCNEHGATRWQVGDAALALDPLSGQGVYEAVRGARLVAMAVQSVLAGGDSVLAHRFVDERQHEAWFKGVRMAAGFYRENAARSAFWVETAADYERLVPATAPMAPCIGRRPVLADGRIVERDVVITAQHPRGVWHVAGVPLVTLKGYLESAPQATLAAAAAAFGRPTPAVAAAIHWLQHTGVVGPSSRPRMPLGG